MGAARIKDAWSVGSRLAKKRPREEDYEPRRKLVIDDVLRALDEGDYVAKLTY